MLLLNGFLIFAGSKLLIIIEKPNKGGDYNFNSKAFPRRPQDEPEEASPPFSLFST